MKLRRRSLLGRVSRTPGVWLAHFSATRGPVVSRLIVATRLTALLFQRI
jgi:hypothetical protein